MKRLLVIVLSLILLLGGALVIGPGFVDWNQYKTQILAQLENATGHQYRVDGTLELAVLPYPHVSIEKLSVSAPAQAAEGTPLVTLERAAAQLELWPLFSGEVIVSSIVLEQPVFTLAVDADGTPSWMTPALEQRIGGGGTTAGLADAVALNQVRIKNGRVTYQNRQRGLDLAVSDINILMRGDSLLGPYNVEGDLAYGGHKIDLSLNSGRLDDIAESLAVQFEAAMPDVASSQVSYSGVVVVKDGVVELQGEAAVQTDNVAALLPVVMGEETLSHPYLEKPLTLRGILTFDPEQISYRNLKLGFASVDGNGSLMVKNFRNGAPGPLDINLGIEVTAPFDLEPLLPDSDQEAGLQQATLLPETITIPRDVTGAINIKSPAVRYGGVTYNEVAFSVDRKEQGYGGQINLTAPGEVAVDLNSLLTFGSRSVSAQDGSVTFSEPTLTLDAGLAGPDPAAFAAALLPGDLPEALAAILAHDGVAAAKLIVTPDQAKIQDAHVTLAETRVNAEGTYSLSRGGARDVLDITLSNFGFDADYWYRQIAGDDNAAVQTETRPDVTAFTKAIDLPFDLEFQATMQSLRFMKRDYASLALKGRLVGTRLVLDTAELQSNAGDTLLVAGGVRDVQALGGIDLSLQADIKDTAQVLTNFGYDATRLPANAAQAEILADIKGAPDNLAFTANLKAMRATMEASGSLANALVAPALSDLTLRLKHPNYVELARLYNPSFNSGVAIRKNLDVFASMSRDADIYTFSQLQAVIGPSRVTGDVVADVSGSRPAITAALKVTELPIDALFGLDAGGTGTVRARPLRQADDVRWSRNAIDTAALHMADLELKATAAEASYGNWRFTNAGVNIVLKDGVMDIRQLDGGLYGGQVALTGALRAPAQERQPLSFNGNVLAQNVNLEDFVQSFSGSRLVEASGTVSLESTLKTSGLSPAALVFDLAGKGTITGQELVFEGFDLARLSRALADPSTSFTQNFTRLLDASMGGGTTRFDTLDGAYTITEGVIAFDKLNLTGSSADVATAGTISLPLWALDLESTVQLKEPVGAPPLRATFKGPIDQPAQTFGQNAMRQYFQQQLEGVVLNPILDKIDDGGVIRNLMGLPGAQGPVQQPQQSQQPQAEPLPQAEPEPQNPAQPTQRREPTPEEAIFGVIEGLLGGQ